MAKNRSARIRLEVGALRLEYEGSEEFFRSELLRLIEVSAKVATPLPAGRLGALRADIDSAVITLRGADEMIAELRAYSEPKSELTEVESLRLQVYADRLSKLMSTLSNILKKISETAQAMTENLK
jgi:hypothetical protein